MNKTTVLIAGGGTGGHISPGIAIYEEFCTRGIRAYFLVGKRDARFAYLSAISGEDLILYGAPPFTSNPLKLPFFALSFALAVWKAGRIIRRTGAACVIGMGGYVSGPALIAARMAKVPVFLCEQNSVPGRVTSFFTGRAARVFTTFEESAEYVKKEYRDRLRTAGNPIRKNVLKPMDRESARKTFNLRHSGRVVLVIGGSQGALAINELTLGLLSKYPDELKNVGFIWSTGSLTYERFKGAITQSAGHGSVYLSPFIEEVGAAYRACDIAISRAGSGVMMELAAMGIPSILIPFPHAALDHQNKNADAFVKAGASIKIANSDAVPEKVMPVLSELLGSPTQLERMSAKAREAARPEAAADIVRMVLEVLAGGGER